MPELATVVDFRLKGISGKAESKDPLTVKQSYVASYWATMSSGYASPQQIFAYLRENPGQPWAGRYLSDLGNSDTVALCKSIDIPERSKGDETIWLVRATFEPQDDEEEDDKDDGNKSKDPTKWHDEIDLSYQPLSVPLQDAVYLGASNNATSPHLPAGFVGPVCDSAGMPFIPPVETEEYIQILRITRHQKLILGSTTDVAEWDAFSNTINSGDVTIHKPAYGFSYLIGKHKGLLMPVTASFQITNGISYWNTTVEVHVHPRKWNVRFLDEGKFRGAGFGEPDGRGGTWSTSNPPPGAGSGTTGTPAKVRIKDKWGNPVTSLLNGKGQPLEPGEPPVFLNYRKYTEKDWSPIAW